MKLGIVTTMAEKSWGGSEELWYLISKELLDRGHQVAASVYDWGDEHKKITKLKSLGANVQFRSRLHYPQLGGRFLGKTRQLTTAFSQLKKFVNKEKPDVILFSQGAPFDLCVPYFYKFVLFLNEKNIPYFRYLSLNSEDDVLPFDDMLKERETFSNAVTTYFASYRNMHVASRQVCFDFKNGQVITNPVTVESLDDLAWCEDPVVQFASVARLTTKVKGQGILLQILSEDKWKKRNWHLNIFGTGPDKEYLEELMKFYELTDKVTFHGFSDGIRNGIWKDNHVLLMPSYMEGCPISLYDAMLCNRVAVVSDVGGSGEIVEDNISGFIASCPSPIHFGEAMERLWERKGELKEIGNLAKKRALEYINFSPEKNIVNEILECFDNR